MSTTVCPYLGLLEDPEAHLNYPSFENRCFSTVAREAIPLSEQAVFCLGGQCQSCPRFMALHGAPGANAGAPMPAPPLDMAAPVAVADQVYLAATWAEVTGATPLTGGGPPVPPGRLPRDYSLAVILGGILLGIFLCTGATAGYFSLRALVATALRTTPTPATSATPISIVLVSVTPTPTPLLIPGQATPSPAVVETIPPAAIGTPTLAVFPTDVPIDFATPTPIGIQDITPIPVTPVEVPTRRPSPTLTPLAITPTLIPSPTFTPSTALAIAFTTSKASLLPGQCATNFWEVRNAKEVRYQAVVVATAGSRQECPTKTTTYELTVTDLTNAVTKRTLTVTVLAGTPSPTATRTVTITPWPTPTPTVTPSETPTTTPTPTPTLTPTLTPTFTPIPTATATPFYIDWVYLPDQYSGPGPDVTISFVNHSTTADSLAYSLSEVSLPEGWQAEACSADGCGDSGQTPSVAPGESTTITVKVTIPAEAAGGQGSLALRGRSVADATFSIRIPIAITP